MKGISKNSVIIILVVFIMLLSACDGFLGIKGTVYEWTNAPTGETGKIYIDEELPEGIDIKPIADADITISPMGSEDSTEIIMSFVGACTDSSGNFEHGYVVAPTKAKFQIKVEKEAYFTVEREFMHPINGDTRTIIVLMVKNNRETIE